MEEDLKYVGIRTAAFAQAIEASMTHKDGWLMTIEARDWIRNNGHKFLRENALVDPSMVPSDSQYQRTLGELEKSWKKIDSKNSKTAKECRLIEDKNSKWNLCNELIQKTKEDKMNHLWCLVSSGQPCNDPLEKLLILAEIRRSRRPAMAAE